MKKKTRRKFQMKTELRNPYATLGVAVLNVVLFVCAVILYGRYTDLYKMRLQEENLGNISNLNQAPAVSATTLMNSWDV